MAAITTKPVSATVGKPQIITPTITPPHLIGTNTLLTGFVGHGKTSSIPTFIKAGLKHNLELKVGLILTETGAVESLLDAMRLHAPKGMKSLPLDRLYYHHLPPVSEGWGAITEMAKKVNLMSYKDLSEMKTGVARAKHRQFLDLLSILSNFKDQNGNEHGPVDKLDSSWLIGIDSVSGINRMARKLTVGLKPAPHRGEWGVMMSTEEELVYQFIASTKCFTVLTSHIDKEMDEVVGKPQFVPAFLGSKLGPNIPREFSDVVLQVRDGDKFHWSTVAKDHTCLKARNLPLSDKLQPSFEPIVDAWLKRKSLVESGQMTAEELEASQT